MKKFLLPICSELVCIKVTKNSSFDRRFIKSLWSSRDVNWVDIGSYGRSGGLLILWDGSKVEVVDVLKGGYSLLVKVSFLQNKVCWISNIYEPNDYE